MVVPGKAEEMVIIAAEDWRSGARYFLGGLVRWGWLEEALKGSGD